MSKEQQQIIDEAYKNYLIEDAKVLPNMSKEKMTELGFRLTQEEFINKCKIDPEFSETWGLKIEERELSWDERADLSREKRRHSWTWQNWSEEEMEWRMNNDWNIPTKLITITYNNETIESYEQRI